MKCVVCGGDVTSAIFPNAWEASLRIRACCSERCKERFDSDLHWIPSSSPAAASEAESLRLLAGGDQRLRAGDDAGPVVRDLLVAGVEPWRVRKLVERNAAAAALKRKLAFGLSLMTLAGGWLWGSTDRRDPGGVNDCVEAMEAWERRFGPSR